MLTEPEYKLQDLQEDIQTLADQLKNGCRDGGCVIKKPSGMHTNAGCRCTPRQIQDRMLELASMIDRMKTKGARWE